MKGCHICQMSRNDKPPVRQLQTKINLNYRLLSRSKKLNIKIRTVAPYNLQSLRAEHGIKSLSTILSKHLTDLDQILPKYLPLATLAYNTFITPSLAIYSPYELVFCRKPKLLLDLETIPDIRISGTFKDYYTLLNKRFQYLYKLL